MHADVESRHRSATLTVRADCDGDVASRPRSVGRRRPTLRRRRARPGPVVAARPRRAAPLRPARSSCWPTTPSRRRCATSASGFRTVRARHRRPTRTARRSPSRQRAAGARQRRQLDPRRLLPAPGRPRPLCDRGIARRHRGRRQPAAGLGRRHLRERRLLRRLRRDRPDWSGRTSCSPAPPTPRRSRCAARSSPRHARRSPGSAPHPSLVLWNGNNENLWGYEDWGWQPRARRPHLGRAATTSTCCPRSWPSSTRRGPYSPGSPWSLDERPAPQRPRPRHHAHLGRLEPRDYTAYRDYCPAVRRRVRLPGAARLVDPAARRPRRPADARLAGDAAHQKAEDGNLKLTGASRRTSQVPADMDDWHWAMSAATRPARSRSASSTSARWHRAAAGHDRLAAQRLLAGHLLGRVDGDGRPQAALVRAAARLRRPAADRPAPRSDRLAVVLGQRHRRAVADPSPVAAQELRRVGAGRQRRDRRRTAARHARPSRSPPH